MRQTIRMGQFPLIFVLVGLLWTSCKKDNQSPSDPLAVSLINNWQWVQRTTAVAVNGTPYDTLTPANTGINELLYMNADSTWSEIWNSKVVNGGRFKMLTEFTPAGPISSLDFIGKGGLDSTVNHWISHDTLYTTNMNVSAGYSVDVYVRWVCIYCSGQ